MTTCEYHPVGPCKGRGAGAYPWLVAPDTRLYDAVQFEEIELYGEVVIAASAHDRPLTLPELDAVLFSRSAP